ncbi:MAG: FdtA/QdtA family cupin domain-containing protein [Rickettsiales bacterium]|nr:FdtA/QdtA family cupin domain-containing protein [Rickettsiales bacterium]
MNPTLDMPYHSKVQGVVLYRLKKFAEPRGCLVPGQFPDSLPFIPQRFFMVFNVPAGEVRGNHAKMTGREFILCAHGGFMIEVDDGKNRESFRLESPDLALYVPSFTWAREYDFTPESLELVFASQPYDPSDYISDYGAFLAKRLEG